MFRLALALGCTVRELGLRLSAAELTEWQAFYAIEPWGGAREDQRARGIMEILLASNGAKNIDKMNLLPVFTPEPEPDPEEQFARFMDRMDALAEQSEKREG